MSARDKDKIAKELQKLVAYGATPESLTEPTALTELLSTCLPQGVDDSAENLLHELQRQIDSLAAEKHQVPVAGLVSGEALKLAFHYLFRFIRSNTDKVKGRRAKAQGALGTTYPYEAWRKRREYELMLWLAGYIADNAADDAGYHVLNREFIYNYDSRGDLTLMESVWTIQALRRGVQNVVKAWHCYNEPGDMDNLLQVEAVFGLAGVTQTYQPASHSMQAVFTLPYALEKEQVHTFAERAAVPVCTHHRPYAFCGPAIPHQELRITARFTASCAPAEVWWFAGVSYVNMPGERDQSKLIALSADGFQFSHLFRDCQPGAFYGMAWEWPDGVSYRPWWRG